MKISSLIHQLKIQFKIQINNENSVDRFVNVFLITGKDIYLIDTGVKGCEKVIYQYIHDLGRNKNEIKKIFLTHAHPDHIGALKSIKEDTGAEIYIHKAERLWIENIDKQFEERPVPGFYNLVEGSVIIDHEFSDDEIIQPEENITIRVIYTPGHSDGSVSFFYEEERSLFSGDAIILPGELPIYNNVSKYFNSLHRINKELPLNIMLSSWDMPQYNNDIKNYIENSRIYIEKIDKVVKGISSESKIEDPMKLCAEVVLKLGLPPIVINPLLAKSFMAHTI